MLGGAAPRANYVQFPLREQRENLYVADLDAALVEHGQFFFVAHGDAFTEEQMESDFPQMLRVASPDHIDAVLRSYTRALPLKHTHRLPPGMPIDERASYFQLQKHGPFWEDIREGNALAVFVPSEMDGLELKLVAVTS